MISPTRLTMQGTTPNLFVSPWTPLSRSCAPRISTFSTCTGGTMVPQLRRLWIPCTPSFFKERSSIWYASIYSHFPLFLRSSFLQGISDSPAWVVSKANQYAKDHGKTPFCIYQGNWSILERSFERDIIPMARSEGLALAPWGVLGGGKIRSNAEEARHKESGEKG